MSAITLSVTEGFSDAARTIQVDQYPSTTVNTQCVQRLDVAMYELLLVEMLDRLGWSFDYCSKFSAFSCRVRTGPSTHEHAIITRVTTGNISQILLLKDKWKERAF